MISGLQVGTHIGVFRIDSLLGVGGMGEVYRARDTKLNRDVAIKVLPAAFANDADRLARFKREAQVLASLNHPNIAGIYGFEDQDGIHALVLELIEGPTLADRVAHGPIPLDEALAIARQIAEALEAAHEQGIIHRDLKPANIKVRDDGTVKVLDFGLAKLAQPDAVLQPGVTQSPTITTPAMTAAGMILGTAAYMSPEQAKGRPADRRSDIWAFGCVLYEMLTGRRPFEGDDVADTLANVLTTAPDWNKLPATTPQNVRNALRRCLQKDRKLRWADISDTRFALDERPDIVGIDSIAVTSSQRRLWRERALWMIVTIGMTALALRFGRPSSTPTAPSEWYEVTTPPTRDPVAFAISPDGSQLVAVVDVEGRATLWWRSLRSDESRVLPHTDGAQTPFWSPDSASVGFYADGALKRIDLDGNVVRPLARVPLPSGGTWGRRGVILFTTTALSPLFKIDENGGTPVAVTTLRRPAEGGHSAPSFLPDGRHFLFHVNGQQDVAGVYVADLDGGAPRRLNDATSAAIYLPPGLLLFGRGESLMAQPFDGPSLTLSGREAQVVSQVAVLGTVVDTLAASATESGTTLAFRSGSGGRRRIFMEIDRSGKTVRTIGDPDMRFPANPNLAPDGRTLVFSRLENGNTDIWSLDVETGARRRLTSGLLNETYPAVSADGMRICYTTTANGLTIATINSDDQAETGTGVTGVPTDWSRDGQYLLYRSAQSDGTFDLHALEMGGGRRSIPIATSRFNEREGVFSPDGHWVLFQSDESGLPEVYLRKFPDGGQNVPISRRGGSQPRWSPSGKEVFFIASDGAMTAVPIILSSSAPVVGAARPLFTNRAFMELQGQPFRQQYVVVGEEPHFIVNALAEEPSSQPITIVRNWNPLSAISPIDKRRDRPETNRSSQ